MTKDPSAGRYVVKDKLKCRIVDIFMQIDKNLGLKYTKQFYTLNLSFCRRHNRQNTGLATARSRQYPT